MNRLFWIALMLFLLLFMTPAGAQQLGTPQVLGVTSPAPRPTASAVYCGQKMNEYTLRMEIPDPAARFFSAVAVVNGRMSPRSSKRLLRASSAHG